jgi:hypothetical protein
VEHATHEAPPLPHAVAVLPGSHAPLAGSQQPAHDVGSQEQAPATQRCPAGHPPSAQSPPQPSLAPHALPVQSGVHGPTPHAFGPPAPHVMPGMQPPQSVGVMQRSRI